MANVWTLVATYVFEQQGAAAPSDLAGPDAGFLYLDTTTGLTYQWSGAVAHWHQGIRFDVFANRPVAFVGCDAGVIFCATDSVYGGQCWELDFGTNAWVLLPGVGGPGFGLLSAIPTGSLGGTDGGFKYLATDYNRIYAWGGAGWVDAFAAPARKQISYFDAAPDTNGWQLCDGSTVTISTPTGGTGSYTVPNLITGNSFIRSNSTSGGTGGHNSTNVTIPGQTTSGESADVAVTITGATGSAAAGPTHTHTTPSQVVAVPTVPLYHDLIPYVRL